MSISWFLLLDKPYSFTSFDLVAKVRRILWVKKVWHAGTLDPLATWLMLIWAWEATWFLHWHTHDNKSYNAKIKFWDISNTYDLEGEIKSTNFIWKITKQKLIETLESFKWKIIQTPPQYSAVKIQWRKACDLMREWWDIKIPSREVEIFEIKIIEYKYPNLELFVNCSSWTYIRSIANDLWKRLWCWAYLAWLIRTWIQDLKLEDAISIEEISKEKLLPCDYWLEYLEILEVKKDIIWRMKHWQRIKIWDLKIGINSEKMWSNLYRIYSDWKFYWIWKINHWILKWEKIIN